MFLDVGGSRHRETPTCHTHVVFIQQPLTGYLLSHKNEWWMAKTETPD